MKFVYKKHFLLLNLSIVCSFIPILTITSCKNESKPVEPDDKNEDVTIENADQFFPKINVKDYYNLIEFKEHLPTITDKLKVKVIQDVVDRVASSLGEINFNIEEISEQKIIFHFKWVYNENTLYKNYIFDFDGLQENFNVKI